MTELFAQDSWLNTSISMISDFMWSHFLIAMLIGCGLYFTWRLRFAQFRMIGEMVRLLSESVIPRQGEKHISSFQAFAVSVATRVGTGNLAGVASAIAIGGSGAIFWMWVTSLVGAASAFVESTLAQLYKRRSKDSFVGGPAYYMIHGWHRSLPCSSVSPSACPTTRFKPTPSVGHGKRRLACRPWSRVSHWQQWASPSSLVASSELRR